MSIDEIKSRAELSRFIESYWHFNGCIQPDLVLLPDGTFHVIIVTSTFLWENMEFPSGIYLVPISTQPIHIVSSGCIFGIRFKAFSLQNIIGKKAGLVKRINELETLIPGTFNKEIIQSDLGGLAELKEKKSALENLAFDLLNKQYFINEQLRAQVNYILDRKGDIRVSELCSEMSITRQGLHKNFVASLGIGPKELAMTWKLNHYFTLLSQEQSLTETAIDAGFFDQAHSINSFKTRWNVSPGSLRRSDPHFFQYAQDTMRKRFSNFFDPES